MITDRIDNVTRIPQEYRTATPPAPKSVKIEITGKCNFKCGFCPLMTRKNKGKDMQLDLFYKVAKEISDLNIAEVGVFFMGESFSSPDLLVKVIKHLKQDLGIPYVFLTSNGSLADHHTVERCMMAGLDSLKWSTNIADKDQFSKIVGVKKSIFDDVFENIRLAHKIREKRGYKTKLYASSIHYDNEQLALMKDLLSEKVIPYVDQHYWLPLYSMGSLAIAKEKELGLMPTAGNSGRFDNPVPPIPCWTLFTEAHIMSDGRMTACCADATGNWVMGDISKEPFMQAWHSGKFQKLRKAHLENKIKGTDCEDCIIYK
jgi:radical SAM protein with 4Fe4S-binding SPASM domain